MDRPDPSPVRRPAPYSSVGGRSLLLPLPTPEALHVDDEDDDLISAFGCFSEVTDLAFFNFGWDADDEVDVFDSSFG